jgi:hypothetical protein
VKPLTAPVRGAPWQVHLELLQALCTSLVLASVAELEPFNNQNKTKTYFKKLPFSSFTKLFFVC